MLLMLGEECWQDTGKWFTQQTLPSLAYIHRGADLFWSSVRLQDCSETRCNGRCLWTRGICILLSRFGKSKILLRLREVPVIPRRLSLVLRPLLRGSLSINNQHHVGEKQLLVTITSVPSWAHDLWESHWLSHRNSQNWLKCCSFIPFEIALT